MQLKTKKWIGLIVAALLGLLLSMAVDSTPIASRAIVAGIAIDMDEETSEVEVTAQILVAAGQGSSADAKQVSAKSKTISGAFNDISKLTSMMVSLAHCNLVILGKNVLNGSAYRVLDYLIRNAYLSENAMLLGSETDGKDVLNTKVAFSELASFFAQRSIFSYGTYQGIVKRTIKSFITDFNKPSQTNYLPLIEKTKEPLDGKEPGSEKDKAALSDESSGGSGSSGSSGGDAAKDEEFLFRLTKTGVLKGEKMVITLDEDGTSGLNYVQSEVKRGALTVPNENGEFIELYVINKNIGKNYDLETRTVRYDLSLSVIYKEEMKPVGNKKYEQTIKMSQAEEAIAADIVAKNIRTVFENTRPLGLDVYGICEAFHGKYREKFDTDFLESVALDVRVSFVYN